MSDSMRARTALDLTAKIVSAHVQHNQIQADALPSLIQGVYRSLAEVATGSSAPSGTGERPQPAVPIKQSVFPEYIVCLEDGVKLKTLKRHLRSAFNMTPAQYRERWRLPATYPMVAPAVSGRRSAIAKASGLGHNKPAEAPKLEPTVTHVRARRAKGSRG